MVVWCGVWVFEDLGGPDFPEGGWLAPRPALGSPPGGLKRAKSFHFLLFFQGEESQKRMPGPEVWERMSPFCSVSKIVEAERGGKPQVSF